MRLICPNCGAQYDVPTEVIPEGGRDVQCSNCGHTWYQHHPDDDAASAEDLNLPLPDREWQPEDEEEVAPPPPLPAAERPIRSQRPASESAQDPAPEPELPRTEAAKPRGLDPDVADIFREEREYEARQRAADTIETQPELGLQDPDEDELARRSRQARDRMSRMRGEEPVTPRPAPRRPATPAPRPQPDYDPTETTFDALEERAISEAAAAAAAASSRRDLLPNVDEINQTLRSSGEPRVIDSAPRGRVSDDRPAKRGFGRGFVTMVAIAAAAVALYAFAPAISTALPPAAPVLDGYVAQVDKGRAWLDGQLTELLQTLDGMSSEAGAALDEAHGTPATTDTAPASADGATPTPSGN